MPLIYVLEELTMKKKRGHVTVVLGGMAGSEGKGKFAGYLANKGEVDIAVANFMPNAGHTWVDDEGNAHLVQQLPQAATVPNKDISLVISGGAAIELPMLLDEIEKFDAHDRLVISPRAMVIEDRHREAEAEQLQRISSTLKGCGHALADKVSRGKDVKLAGDIISLRPYTEDVSGEVGVAAGIGYALSNIVTEEDVRVMVECPQGFDLDINHGLEYPYCTSRQTTSAQALADAGIAPQLVDEVIAVIRPYPIRVGDAYDKDGNKIGTSGSYGNAKELTWEEVAERGGVPFEEIRELTTVTKKLRRVFEIDWERLKAMVLINGVTQIALNFANYIDWEIKGATEEHQITPKVLAFMQQIQLRTGVPVTLIGTGAKDGEIIDLRGQYGK